MAIQRQGNLSLLAGTAVSLTAFLLPCLLLVMNIRLVMTPAFLHFEYTRPGFPADFYGFTVEDRLNYAPYALDYLLRNEDISFLGDLTFPDGSALFNERELRHMHDVGVVTQVTYTIAFGVGMLWLLMAWWLKRRGLLYIALLRGSLLTLGLIVSIVLAAILSWDTFFTTFHALFFESGTWYFAYSDTLIRLFPEQFWFDAALLIGGLTSVQAVIILVFAWFSRRDVN